MKPANVFMVHCDHRKCDMWVQFRKAVHVFNHIIEGNFLCDTIKSVVIYQSKYKSKVSGYFITMTAWLNQRLLFYVWTSYLQVSKNIVMEAYLIRPAHFTGITCTAYQRREASAGNRGMEMAESVREQQLHFHCSTGAHNTSLNNFSLKVSLSVSSALFTWTVSILTKKKEDSVLTSCVSYIFVLQNSVALASVTLLRASLFASDAAADCKLQFIVYRTGSFFPFTANSSNTAEHSRRRTVNSPVVFVGLGKKPYN